MLFLDPKKTDPSLPSVAQNDTSKIVCTSILKTTPLKQKKLEWGTPAASPVYNANRRSFTLSALRAAA